MRPIHLQSGYVTMDLTMGAVHRLKQDDGSTKIVAWFPKKWEALPRQKVMGAAPDPSTKSGHVELEWVPYHVTEFDEVVLQVIPAG